jgi:hypothetical protein
MPVLTSTRLAMKVLVLHLELLRVFSFLLLALVLHIEWQIQRVPTLTQQVLAHQ